MRKFLERLYTIIVFLFLYAPIVVMIVFSFNDSKLRGRWVGFTTDWYKELFSNPEIISAVKTTLIVAVVATIVATIIGTLSAIGISELRGRKKNAILNINYLPVLNPDIITAISLMGLYGFLKLNLGYITLILSHVMFCIPYVVLTVLPAVESMDKNIIEAALDLGATPSYAVRKVLIPNIKNGIFAGALISFTLSLDDFAISYFTSGNGVSNLSMTIYAMARRGINPSINALSAIIFVVVFIFLLIQNRKVIFGKEENPTTFMH
ncbi:ABC transporter permease [uncultured Anaerococcus sp.]|uniref:ABC transporter permease n=1 Tax=uncultured Anaerococcus sp. TaxID=293428 RepID=UPI0025E426B6|nr:ABC transporter permease [uncultured Anaerococcus sp.]